MKALIHTIIWQSTPVETGHPIQQQATELESHYVIPAVFMILVVVAVAGIVITAQKHKHHR